MGIGTDHGRRRAHAGPPADEQGEELAALLPVGRPRGAGRRSVRFRLASLLAVPVLALALLSVGAVASVVQTAQAQQRSDRARTALPAPVAAAVTAMEAERTAAAQYLAAPDAARAAALTTLAGATDRAASALGGELESSVREFTALAPELPARVADWTAADGSLPALRGRIAARTVGWTDAEQDYTADIDAALAVDGALSGLRGPATATDPRVLLELAQGRDLLAREDAAVRSAAAAGRMGPEEYQEFTSALEARRALDAFAAPDLQGPDLTSYQLVAGGPAATVLGNLETAVRSAGPGTAFSRTSARADWTPAAQALEQQLATVGADPGSSTADVSALAATPAGLAALFGLTALLLALVVAARVGGSLVQGLSALRAGAVDLAGRRLPAALGRMRAGEVIDLDAEAPLDPVDAGADEIGQVGAALTAVERVALRAAAERTAAASGISEVFVGLARRSQVLVHRQLGLLDLMERRTEDPAELADLFRLDHLTTRMRRYAESLIILSGAAPGRAWRQAVPLSDVVRSAIAEVEDYARVELRGLPQSAVTGAAVADLTHLLAELVENATGFSPPDTRVVVSGRRVGAGYLLEVEDRGLGMGPEGVAEANRRIADTRQGDLPGSDRLGLFVVNRLSRRHGIRVSLRPSRHGGTTAVVLLPSALLEPAARRPDAAPTGAPTPSAAAAAPAGPAPAAETEPVPVPVPVPAPAAEPVPVPGRPVARARFAASAHGAITDAAPDRPDAPTAATATAPPESEPESEPQPQPEPAAVRVGELPRRVRQSNLKVQLREAPAAEAVRPTSDRVAPARDPELARARMAAFQEGWTLGRGHRRRPLGDSGATANRTHRTKEVGNDESAR